MYIVLIVIHMIVCCVLIATILLQAGRGGGLNEMFGGGETMQSVLGTQAPVILKKATTVSAIVFILTSLLLGMITARRGKSLFEGTRVPPATTVPASPVSVPQEAPPPAEVPPPQEVPAPQEAQ